MVQYDRVPIRLPHKDWRHTQTMYVGAEASGAERARGLIFQVSRHEFYLVGAHYRLLLRPKVAPEQAIDTIVSRKWLAPRLRHYVTVEEGHFDDAGRYVATRRRNGDETDWGLWAEPDCGVVHAVLTDCATSPCRRSQGSILEHSSARG